MKGRPAYRKRLTAEHPFAPDDAECCAVCGLPETNRHHKTQPTPAQPAEEPAQMRLDIDG